MANQKQLVCIGIIATCVMIPSIIMLSNSFSIVQQTQVGLDYSAISKQLDTKIYQPGLHFLGLGHSFITFPVTWQTMEFSTGEDDLLYTRTSDGLPLILGVSFQYKLMPDKVYDLYMAYLTNHQNVLFLVANNKINEIATTFPASTYFDDKAHIASVMRAALNQTCATKYFCTVEAFQIQIYELPDVYDDAIQTTITTKQNITATENYIANIKVNLDTNLIVARKAANVTVIAASGTYNSILASRNATAQVTKAVTNAQAEAYGTVQGALGFKGHSDLLMQYVWWDTLAGTTAANQTQMLVGLNPATYIS